MTKLRAATAADQTEATIAHLRDEVQRLALGRKTDALTLTHLLAAMQASCAEFNRGGSPDQIVGWIWTPLYGSGLLPDDGADPQQIIDSAWDDPNEVPA